MPIETMTFRMAHNMVMGFVPSIVTEEVLNKAISENPPSTSSFGLFGSDINFNTYYPEVTAEDLQPKESDFVEPLFRALSMVTLNKSWNPISFEKPGVLKNSMKLLLGQSIYPNHEAESGNELGVVSKVFWQEEYTSKDGIKIPAGVNAILKIDGKSNPKIARGIMMDPPSVHSTSVTVTFAWEKSHPDLSDDDFRRLNGTIGSDGILIRKVASKIIAYHEISVVPHGADAFAQKVNSDGEIVNPRYANAVFSRTLFDFKCADNSFEIETIKNTSNPQKQNIMEFPEFLSSLNLGADIKFDKAEDLSAYIKGLITESNSYKAVVAKTGDKPLEFISALENKQKSADDVAVLEFVKAEGGLDKVKGFKQSSEAPLKNVRDEAVKFYKLCHPDTIDNALVANIEASTFEAATAFVAQYRKEFNEKVPLTCKACGSTDVDRSSFVDDGATKPESPKPKTLSELRASVYSQPLGGGAALHSLPGKKD